MSENGRERWEKYTKYNTRVRRCKKSPEKIQQFSVFFDKIREEKSCTPIPTGYIIPIIYGYTTLGT